MAGFPAGLSEHWVPVEDNDFVPFTAQLDGVETTEVEVAIMEPNEDRPLTGWLAHPGPKTPNTRGRFPVMVRQTGGNGPAICLGYLVVF